jgi:hypothetical protein
MINVRPRSIAGGFPGIVAGMPVRKRLRSIATGGATDGVPTVEYIDGGGTTGTSITVSSMAEDEFAIIVAGVSGNSWMRSIGRTSTDMEISTIQIGHNGSGWESVHMAYAAPLPKYSLTHATSIEWSIGSSDNPAWCRARFRKLGGFRCSLIASERVNQGSQSDTFTITPFTNPMTEPGGICITGAFKDYTNYPTTVTGTGWAKGGNGGLTIQGYYILSTEEIETPPAMAFTGGGGSHYWAGMVAYLR